MRFQFLKPRTDVASAEQVRALRERRGWTAEQLADEVHASALEVSAWEAGVVVVPPQQALLIRWHTDALVWADALVPVRGELCDWARENAPDQYDQILRDPAALRVPENAPVRAHVAGCGACQAALARARQIGGFPAKPDTSGSLLARYRHWADRLPAWVRPPFALAGAAVEITLPLAFVALLAPEAWAGFLLAFGVFAVTSNAFERVRYRRLAGFLSVSVAVVAGLLGWSLFPGNDLRDPRPWAVVAALAAAAIGGYWIDPLRRAWAGRRKARALAAGGAPVPALSSPPPDSAAILERRARTSSTL